MAMDYLSSIPISFLWVYSSDPALVTNGNTHARQYIHRPVRLCATTYPRLPSADTGGSTSSPPRLPSSDAVCLCCSQGVKSPWVMLIARQWPWVMLIARQWPWVMLIARQWPWVMLIARQWPWVMLIARQWPWVMLIARQWAALS